jgi:hypothetical protein
MHKLTFILVSNPNLLECSRRRANDGIEAFMQEEFPGNAVYPEIKNCPECDCVLQLQKTTGQCMLITSQTLFVDIYTAICTTSGCNQKPHSFQGNSLCIVNWHNQILLTMECALNYLSNYAGCAQPTSVWWESHSVVQLGLEHCDERIKKSLGSKAGHLAEAMAGTAELIEFNPATFKCCENPMCVAMDGTVISIARMRMPKLSRPWQDPSPYNVRATTRTQRQLPHLSKQLELIVNEFTSGQNGISNADLHRLVQSGHPGLVVLASLAQTSNSRHKCYPEVKEFGNCLVRTIAPAILLVPPSLFETVQSLAELGPLLDIESKHKLMHGSPIIFSLFTCIMRYANNAPSWMAMTSLLHALLQLARYTVSVDDSRAYTDIPEQTPALHSESQYNPPNSDLNELWETGSYFPGRPIVRKMKNIRLRGEENERVACSKSYNEGGRCSQGVILVYCVEHSNCIGFIVQNEPESPRVIYEMLGSRFRVMPKIVMYDNGCNLHEYVLNRAPKLFKDTYFLVDGFHANSHRNCMPAYDTGKYMGLCRGLNSSLLEQKNARYTKLKFISPLQRFRSFVALLRFAVAKNNLDQWRKNMYALYLRARGRT